MKFVWAIGFAMAVACVTSVGAVERPLPRPVADLSEPRPVARPTSESETQLAMLRPTQRPTRGPGGAVAPASAGPEAAPTDVASRVEAAIMAQAARAALDQAFPGAEVARAATTSMTDLTAFQDPALATPLPRLRPSDLVDVMSSRGGVAVPDRPAIRRSVRPMPRVADADRALRLVQAAMAAPQPLVGVDGSLLRSMRPALRPELQLALGRRWANRSNGGGGGLCERGSIQGERIAPVPGRGACGIPNAVRVTQVAGVSLSRAARMDCGTARALDDWVRKGVLPTVGRHGGGAVRLEVAAGYACRTRNNQPGARISEHGKGRAIDISGIRLANGTEISVLRDWGRGREGRMLSAMWRAACGPFGTVLGPNSDRFHRDHFHFDTARYRSGSYCR